MQSSAALGFSDTDHCLRHCNLRICVNFIVNIIHILGSINYNVLAILDKCISCQKLTYNFIYILLFPSGVSPWWLIIWFYNERLVSLQPKGWVVKDNHGISSTVNYPFVKTKIIYLLKGFYQTFYIFNILRVAYGSLHFNGFHGSAIVLNNT